MKKTITLANDKVGAVAVVRISHITYVALYKNEVVVGVVGSDEPLRNEFATVEEAVAEAQRIAEAMEA